MLLLGNVHSLVHDSFLPNIILLGCECMAPLKPHPEAEIVVVVPGRGVKAGRVKGVCVSVVPYKTAYSKQAIP